MPNAPMRSMRPGTARVAARPLTIVMSSIPSARPIPNAASALRTLNRPGNATVTRSAPRLNVDPSPSSRTSVARSSASASIA